MNKIERRVKTVTIYHAAAEIAVQAGTYWLGVPTVCAPLLSARYAGRSLGVAVRPRGDFPIGIIDSNHR